jgi:hypothetical protein
MEGVAATRDLGFDCGDAVCNPRVKHEDKRVPGKDDQISQGPGVCLNVRSEVRAEAARQHEVHLALEQTFDLFGEREIIPEAPIFCQVNQQVYISDLFHDATECQLGRSPPANLMRRPSTTAQRPLRLCGQSCFSVPRTARRSHTAALALPPAAA